MKIKLKRILSLLLVTVMVFTLLPYSTSTASAEVVTGSGSRAIRLDAANYFGITGGGQSEVYFGDYPVSSTDTPIKWRVLSTDLNGDSFQDSTGAAYPGNGLFLMSEYVMDDYAVQFDTTLIQHPYTGSNLQAWSSNLYNSSFTTTEKAAVLQTTKNSDAGVGIWEACNLSGDRLFSLSAAEVTNTGYGFASDPDTGSKRVAYKFENTSVQSGEWWLRSSCSDMVSIGMVLPTGSLSMNPENSRYGVRPAFNLNLSSILFTSAAEGGKSVLGMDQALTAVPTSTPTEWKMTLLDSNRTFAASTTPNTSVPTSGGIVSVGYTGAMAGTNEYVSAMLVDESGTPLYYGRIKAVSNPSDTTGIANITIPSGLTTGSYTLKVFSEQYNGDKVTDYASNFVNIPLTVVDTYITPLMAVFDKYSPADVTITKTGTRTLSRVLKGIVTLSQDTDYTMSSDIITIKKEYLETLDEGMTTLNFDYGMSVNPTLSIMVIDSTPASYFALGDSIATGYGLAGYQIGTIPGDAYVSMISNSLGGRIQTAMIDGLTSSLLLHSLPSVITPMPSIKVVTLSIGSDDVLLPFLNIVAQKVGCTTKQLQTALAQADPIALAGYLAALDTNDGTGLKNNAVLQASASGFVANFQGIISKLKAYAPNAKIYVTNIYNPYKGINIPYGVGTLELGSIADTYIQTLNSAFDANSTDYTLIDVYSAFSASLASGTSPVNTNLATLNFDPHPNKVGHALIADLILANYNVPSNAPSVSPASLTVSKNCTASLNIDLGQGVTAATGAAITVGNESVASVSPAALTASGSVTVTGLSGGSTNLTVAFNDQANTSITVPITVPITVQAAPIWLSGSTLTASDITSTGVTLSWTAANDATAVTGYRIYQNGTLIGTVAGTITTYSVTGLSASTSYSFQVQAGNADGLWTSNGPSATTTTSAASTGNTGSGSGNSAGGNYSSGNSSSGSSTANVTTPDTQPGQPSIAEIHITPTMDSNGHATATISQQSVEDAIAKALANADTDENGAKKIGVSLNFNLPDTAQSLSATLSQDALQSLTNAGITQLELYGGPVGMNLDLEALKEIQKQSGGDVTINFIPATGLSEEAQAVLGNRPVYQVTISYVKDGKTVNVTSLGGSGVTLSIPYTRGQNEAVGYLFGVYVDGNGNAIRMEGSAYDANSGCINISTGHLSIYGVGYTAPSAQYKDISYHWARKSINYVLGRGLLTGTSATTFSPNTSITRGMLVAALGKLAGVDVSGYTTSSFTDVKAGDVLLPYIEWAYKEGIIKGTGNVKFSPNKAVTREEIAVILQNYAKASGYTLPVTRGAVTFADNASIGSAYKGAVKALQKAGILTGKNSKFSPGSKVTRGELSVILYRYIKLTTDPATAQGWARNDSGQWMYFKAGKALTGWQTIDGKVYCFDNNGGTYANLWKQNEKGEWLFLTANGSAQ